ncbi:MAG: tRNA (adenosine(37)-N6)-threonylcarbamoyltransferase complex ATPase subunit type 1 TsaE [Actinobacteria bacterium]|nr:tRNA (adenosine(37)-N6)-threonylcarbamoyltransferase complex ATPase subunit type 1 TsaE [Actinomycetota bacterium]MCB9412040.1 tRNA (adenosine(37)-N6)-threonylcarbamoyltransferase complex ATPase subunit type 1 TsaE [Actinomycetota bacterium]
MSLVLADEAATEAAGAALAQLLRAGDLLILTGPLGAGKTTFTRGLGRGLGVRGPIASPTFVIARLHPSQVGGPDLLHVDAYRLESAADVDDLDLDSDAAESVTVVEWGKGRAEQLAAERLEVELTPIGRNGEARSISLTQVGSRWAQVNLEEHLA